MHREPGPQVDAFQRRAIAQLHVSLAIHARIDGAFCPPAASDFSLIWGHSDEVNFRYGRHRKCIPRTSFANQPKVFDIRGIVKRYGNLSNLEAASIVELNDTSEGILCVAVLTPSGLDRRSHESAEYDDEAKTHDGSPFGDYCIIMPINIRLVGLAAAALARGTGANCGTTEGGGPPSARRRSPARRRHQGPTARYR